MLRLKEIRYNKGLTQQAMADLLGITRATYTRYESGTRKPDQDTILKLADYFDVTTDYLLGRDPETDPLEGVTLAAHSEIGYGDDLPDDAKEEIKNFVGYIREKYKKK